MSTTVRVSVCSSSMISEVRLVSGRTIDLLILALHARRFTWEVGSIGFPMAEAVNREQLTRAVRKHVDAGSVLADQCTFSLLLWGPIHI